MKKVVEIKIAPEFLGNKDFLIRILSQKTGISKKDIAGYEILRRSIDARGREPLYVLRCEVWTQEQDHQEVEKLLERIPNIGTSEKKVVIVGAGPAGYFAALECMEHGLKPIIMERGKDVQTRRRDLRSIQQFGQVNPDSNYCFGEGGAGTYSDGKLYTRSHKRGSIEKVLRLLVEHGAKSDIMIDAHPHIGSNKLPGIVSAIRTTIEGYGGEVHFESRIVDFLFTNDRIVGVVEENGEKHMGDAVILATGHSARDIFYLCDKYDMGLEAKPFAVGVRIEHPQALIDEIQYNRKDRGPHLPASNYRVACQVGGVGVFSFCMCPGGLIVPTATAPGELVVNGMSLSKRDSPFANAGTVVTIDDSNVLDLNDRFSGLKFQSDLEQSIFEKGDGSQAAPAQRLTDFVEGRLSSNLRDTSYIPGLYSANFKDLLPEFIYSALTKGVVQFDKKLKGYYTEEAQVIGLESRTSSPVKLPREKETLMHKSVKGLFPCGEGAGYAGGILSAAMDGQNVAKAVKKWLMD